MRLPRKLQARPSNFARAGRVLWAIVPAAIESAANFLGAMLPRRAGDPITRPVSPERALILINSQYDNAIVRLYVYLRFRILNRRILERVRREMPAEGLVLSVGCGFGLFDLYFTLTSRALRCAGFDLNPGRVAMASRVAERLGFAETNAFLVADAGAGVPIEQCNCVIILDLLHHISPEDRERLLTQVVRTLAPGGSLVIKDIGLTPLYKLWFTWLLDWLMTLGEPVYYFDTPEMVARLERFGLTVTWEVLPDILPYPHVLITARKPKETESQRTQI